jgi:hypothetical protein
MLYGEVSLRRFLLRMVLDLVLSLVQSRAGSLHSLIEILFRLAILIKVDFLYSICVSIFASMVDLATSS